MEWRTALGLDEPIIYMVESLLSKQPNGYEIAREAGTALESVSLLTTARLNTAIVQKVGEKVLKTQTGETVKGFQGSC